MQIKMICYGMEISESYCDVIIKRYCNFTGADEDAIYRNAIRMDGAGKTEPRIAGVEMHSESSSD